MKVLVTGANGQLGQDVCSLFKDTDIDLLAFSRDDIDLSIASDIANVIAKCNADWVINCAAYTSVDKAEQEADLAFRVNRDAAGEIAKGVLKSNGRLIHLSTDFVFNGKKNKPYIESDEANPLNVYGKSKYEGELVIGEILPGSIILRTSWVYGVHGHNFVKTMLKLAAIKDELFVVNDQYGSPTWTADIASLLIHIVTSDNNDMSGIFHYSNAGVITWFDLACESISYAKSIGYNVKVDINNVKPITTKQYPTPAVRPPYSALSNQKIQKKLNVKAYDWKRSLHTMIGQLVSNESKFFN